MSQKSNIEWTDATWNPVTGCTRVSEGCRNCYAMRLTATRLRGATRYAGLATFEDGKAQWTNEIRLHEDVLTEPLKWKKRRRIFVCSMSDLFHPDVPFPFIAEVFTTMAQATQHTYIVLTKRPERLKAFFDWNYPRVEDAGIDLDYGTKDWLANWPNVHFCTSCEDQDTFNARWPILADTPAAVRGLSLEPLLGPIDCDFLKPQASSLKPDWVIVGGESGPGARPMHPNWVRSIRDQCVAAGVPFFFKQWGDHSPYDPCTGNVKRSPDVWLDDLGDGAPGMFRVGKHAAGRVLDGRTWDEYPIMRTSG